MQSGQQRNAGKVRAGFTLIELLVVVAIIAILMAILLPALSRARDSAKLVHCASGLRQWGIALHYYYNDYDQWTPQEGDTSDPAVKRDDMWFNALPIYVNAPKYYYVYAGANSRVGESGTDAKTGRTYTVSNAPLSGDAGFKNAWIWYCQALINSKKASSTGLNSFHYGFNAVLDGAGSAATWGGGPSGNLHVRATNIPETSSTVFLFESDRNTAAATPANNPTTSTKLDQVDVARHANLGANFLMIDGHVETVKMKNIPLPTRASSADVWTSSTPRLIWGPFQATKVP